VLENFFCDFFLRMTAEYAPVGSEPPTLLATAQVGELYRLSSTAVVVASDHEATWEKRFRGKCSKISKEISPVTKRSREEDPAQNIAVVAKVAKTSKICLKAMFTLFKVGQDKLPKCCGETCKFLHFAKREEVPVPTL
jgi:hypothetical protein